MNEKDLAGEWAYLPADDLIYATVDFDHTAWPTMSIPQNWFLGGLDHHGVVWFRREFVYERPKDGRHVTLHFAGIDYFATVYLNGTHLGHHEGYFEPFAFEVTEELQDGRNLLAVRVDSPYEEPGLHGWHLRKRLIKGIFNHHDCRPGGGWEPQGQSYNTGGIWNRVTLRCHGPTTIEQVLLHANMANDPPRLHATITLNHRGRSCPAKIRLACHPAGNAAGHRPYHTSQHHSLRAGRHSYRLQLPVPSVALWQPWDRGTPHLYQVHIELLPQESEGDSYTTHFGFRTVTVGENYDWTLNSKPYFPRGSNYIASQWLAETLFSEVARAPSHPFPPADDAALPANWFERDVALMKQANLNLVRVHAHVLPTEFYTACDRAGILVWQDFPLQWGYRDDPEFQNEAARQIKAMVHLHYNHPAIVVWCCHNESPWDAPWMAQEAGGAYDPTHNRNLDARLEKAVKTLDTSRHVQRNSGSGDGHTYPGWYGGHWHNYQALPAAPFPSEYGAQALPDAASTRHIFHRYGAAAGHAELQKFKAWLDTQPLYAGYRSLPPLAETPPALHQARETWMAWRFHNFQPPETFLCAGVTLADSLEAFIASSQEYQNRVIQYGTEMYRRHKYERIKGVIHFMLVDPWPAVTWSVLDYWRRPKPSFYQLRAAMQPILVTADLTGTVPLTRPLQFNLCVVNDYLRSFLHTTCRWALLNAANEQVDAGRHNFSLAPDAVTETVTVTSKVLLPGPYRLSLTLHTNKGQLLSQNAYQFTASQQRDTIGEGG